MQVAKLEDPDGAGKEELLLVGGSSRQRGVITSASYAVRKFGVRSGMPTAHALRLCPQAVVVPVPRGACSRKHKEIREVLCCYSPVVESASIDEFYLDVTGTEAVHHTNDLQELAVRIRQEVLERTQISVSIGGGATRVVAKLAGKRAKPGGVHTVPAGGELEFMRTLDLAAIPGVGPRFQERLRDFGLVRVEDVLPFDVAALAVWFGEGTAQWLYDRARGVDDGVIETHGAAKSISRDETFARDINRDDALLTELARLISDAASELRSRELRARTITVKVRDPDFTTRQASHTEKNAIESDRAIYDVARELLARLRKGSSRGIRLLGVALSGFTDRHGVEQLALFSDERRRETERDRDLSRVIDKLRARFGSDAVVAGRALPR
ncbi:MAG TPA: DNA polymerase IV [Longimicrobiales bacterium]|nr:DNA polymerase IV [Longimicrobiales bacterium]